MKRLLVMALFCAPPIMQAQAKDASLPFLYSRETIALHRSQMPAPPSPDFPWQEPQGENDRITLNAEVRDGSIYYKQEGWFNLGSLSDRNGVMMMFNEPVVAPITAKEMYSPMDILFLDKEGNVIQILPKLTLANLEDDIYPESPILAFLFLKGGACEKLSISPGDYVEYKLFKRPPAVLKKTSQGNVPTDAIPSDPMVKQTSPKPLIINTQPSGQQAPVMKVRGIPPAVSPQNSRIPANPVNVEKAINWKDAQHPDLPDDAQE